MRKDQSLDELAEVGNVAQFVAFAPGDGSARDQTYARVAGLPRGHRFGGLAEAGAALLASAPERSVNVRSFAPDDARSREFIYGLTDIDAVVAEAGRLLREGLHVIINETVDVFDGGVSGVVQGGLVEFAPDDTPRCVEKPGAASLPRNLGMRLLAKVYGFAPDVPEGTDRIEFSIHPAARGFRSTRTLLWEREAGLTAPGMVEPRWPNRFSRHLGDKLYGLLIADILGLPVPRTLAICRRIAPFTFGIDTGGDGVWTRTCPVEQEPGRFTTVRGWADPFALLCREDPRQDAIASVLAQSPVRASFSGAALTTADGSLLVEGVAGEGDLFMLAERGPEPLPAGVTKDIASLCAKAAASLGPVRLEWVHDGERAWALQLHVGATPDAGTILVPGAPSRWVAFDVSNGLAALRDAIAALGPDTGLMLSGSFGRTSHVADLVRKARVPTRLSG